MKRNCLLFLLVLGCSLTSSPSFGQSKKVSNDTDRKEMTVDQENAIQEFNAQLNANKKKKLEQKPKSRTKDSNASNKKEVKKITSFVILRNKDKNTTAIKNGTN